MVGQIEQVSAVVTFNAAQGVGELTFAEALKKSLLDEGDMVLLGELLLAGENSERLPAAPEVLEFNPFVSKRLQAMHILDALMVGFFSKSELEEIYSELGGAFCQLSHEKTSSPDMVGIFYRSFGLLEYRMCEILEDSSAAKKQAVDKLSEHYDAKVSYRHGFKVIDGGKGQITEKIKALINDLGGRERIKLWWASHLLNVVRNGLEMETTDYNHIFRCAESLSDADLSIA